MHMQVQYQHHHTSARSHMSYGRLAYGQSVLSAACISSAFVISIFSHHTADTLSMTFAAVRPILMADMGYGNEVDKRTVWVTSIDNNNINKFRDSFVRTY